MESEISNALSMSTMALSTRENKGQSKSSESFHLYWNKIEFGVYLPDLSQQSDSLKDGNSRIFYSYWTFDGENRQEALKRINFTNSHRNISITYQDSGQRKDTFKIDMIKKYLKGRNYETNQETGTLYFQLNYPPDFSKAWGKEESKTDISNEIQWARVKHLVDLDQNDELLRDFFLGHMVIKVTCKKWDLPMSAYDFSEITVKTCSELPPCLTLADLAESNLNFDIKYYIRVWLSHKKTTLFELSQGFLNRLEKLDQIVVEKTCLDIIKTPQSFYYNKSLVFEKFFEIVYEKNKLNKKQWEKIEDVEKSLSLKGVMITPNLIYYSIGLASLSNGILRSDKYKNETWKFLRVSFRDDKKQALYLPWKAFGQRMENYLRCLPLLGRNYEFLAFSPSQLRRGSLWMSLRENNENQPSLAERIHRDIGDLTDIRVAAKYSARLGQLFSASFASFLIPYRSMIQLHPEKPSQYENYPFSEGIGKISMSLMDQIKHRYKIPSRVSAIQIRLGTAKGVLVVDPTIKGDHICIRGSMIKWPESSFWNSLDILNYSKYCPFYLKPQVILLLSFLGIEDQVFLDIQQESIRDLLQNNVTVNLSRYLDNQTPFSQADKLLKYCFDKEVNLESEPFLHGVSRVTMIRALMNVVDKKGIGPFVKRGALLFGVLDEYDVLEEDEIYVGISLSNGEDKSDLEVIEGEVIITKTPCVYPGDIRKMKAVGKEKAQGRWHHILNCIVFPAKGKRPVTNMISGSDLDGDKFYVSWDKRLIPIETVEAMSYNVEDIPEDLKGKLWDKKGKVEIEDVLKHFETFRRNTIGQTINNYFSFMDEMLSSGKHKGEERELLLEGLKRKAQLFSLIVDYGKSGRLWNEMAWRNERFKQPRPCYMINRSKEKPSQASLKSTSVVAKLAENILERNQVFAERIKQSSLEYKNGLPEVAYGRIKINQNMIVKGFEEYLELAIDLLDIYYEQTLAFLSFNGLKTEYEIYCAAFLKFIKGTRYSNKSHSDMEKLQEHCMAHIEALKEKLCILIKLKLGMNYEDQQVQRKLASAVYIITYYNEECDIEEIIKVVQGIANPEKFVFDYKKINQLLGLPWYLFQDFILERLSA